MIYTITTTLPPVHGGRTKSLLSRVKLLEEELNVSNTIITTNYNANYLDVYNKFVNENKASHKTNYENIYDWLSGFNLLVKPKSKFFNKYRFIKTPHEIVGLRKEVIKEKNVVRYYDDNDTYVLYRKYHKDSQVLEFEDFMSPASKKKVERWEYNKYGILHRKNYYSPKTHKRVLEELFDKDGKIYCKKLFEDNDKNRIILIQTYKNNRHHKSFKNEKDFFQYYYENRFKDNDIVFCDARLLDAPLLKQSNKTKNILVFHSSHLDNRKIKSSYKFALEQSDKVSKYLLLTHKQMQDIRNEINIDREKFSIIPHFIKDLKKETKNLSIDDRFIFLGRISPEKQIDHIIYAYKKFIDLGYKTRLDIYGKDEKNTKDKLVNLISQLNLENKITFYDYTDSPLEEFEKSKASFLTSEFEGFGLTLMESIEMGCPVISYDTKYGPSEIISNGKNGYLIKQNDVNALTECMVDIIENPLKEVKTKKELTFDSAIKNYSNLLKNLN